MHVARRITVDEGVMHVQGPLQTFGELACDVPVGVPEAGAVGPLGHEVPLACGRDIEGPFGIGLVVVPGCNVEVVGAARCSQFREDVAFLAGAGGVAAGDGEVGKGGGCGGSEEGEEVVGLVAVGEHAGVSYWVEILWVVSLGVVKEGWRSKILVHCMRRGGRCRCLLAGRI